jgi:transposase-like protein
MNNTLIIGSRNLNDGNWKVFNENGKHMFTCGGRKADWYLKHDLANITGNKEITFNFTPNGNGFEDDEEFGRAERENICVVSGKSDDLQKHHIVPYCYRKYFPDEFKSKNHHDVVLIRYDKHHDYEMIASTFKDKIAEIYGVKTINVLNREYTAKLRKSGKKNAILSSTINSLFVKYGRLTQEEILIKIKIISKESKIPISTLKGYSYVQFYKFYLYLKSKRAEQINEIKIKNRTLYDHGYHVMKKLNTSEKLEDFIKLWRNHFIDNAKPKYMPTGWSVDFRTKTNLIGNNLPKFL